MFLGDVLIEDMQNAAILVQMVTHWDTKLYSVSQSLISRYVAPGLIQLYDTD